jgi:hypothetical protein
MPAKRDRPRKAERLKPVRRPRFDRAAAALAGLWLFFLLAFLSLDTFSPAEQRILGVDPVGYYAWFRSPVFDGDLQFENEYRHLNPRAIAGDSLVDPDGLRTPTGHLPNSFSLGPALLWSPFLFLAHAWAWLGGAPADGFSQPYHSAVFLANAAYGLAGLLLLYYALKTWFPAGVSAVAAAAAWAASPLLYYTYAQEAMSHAPSFFSIALLLFLWARLRQREGYGPWVAVGAALGLATLVRWQNVTFALIPTIDLLARNPRRHFPRLVACGAATVAVFLPQMIGWKIVYGSFVTIPQGGGFMDWGHPRLIRLLFSREYGLITWTPLMALGIAGLFFWPRDNRLPFAALAAAFLVQLYVQAVAGNVGWTFGMRRMDNCLPLFAVGIALLATRIRIRPRYAALIVAPFIVWNFLFALQYGGFLDEYYVERAFQRLAAEHRMHPSALVATDRLPNGQPFDPYAFAYENTFPKGGGPTYRQFVPDKGQVLLRILERLAGG